MVNFEAGLRARLVELERLQQAEVENVKKADQEIAAWAQQKQRAADNYNIYAGGAAEVALMLDQIEKTEKAPDPVEPPAE